MALRISSKHLQIDKAKTMVVALVAISAVVTVFALVASRALLSEANYLNRVNGKKEKALVQLKNNRKAVDDLVVSYKAFAEQNTNLLGGSRTGTGDHDGDNAKLVLDALPSKYDFPALATSLDKLLAGTQINSITGTDDSAAQAADTTTPAPVEIPFAFQVAASYDGTRKMVDTFEKSIRPFHITEIDLNGSNNNLLVGIEAKTYYQPAKDLEFKTEVVK